MRRLVLLGSLLALGYTSLTPPPATDAPPTDWPEYNGGADRNHFSPLTQITPANVSGLKVAWSYASGGADTVKNNTQMQCNPLVVGGVLYGVSAGSQAFAVDAATGREIWKTAFTDDTFAMNSRGVTYWSDGKQARIFFAYGSLLYALDARTGQPIPGFGKGGKINLRDGLYRPGADDYVVSNTPGVVYKNLLILGHRVSEVAPALPGDIRAYDLRTGRLVWTFHTIPHPGEYGADTWPKNAHLHFGGANNWMGMALDRARGIVYAPTGTAAFDLYGGTRPGQNLFGNSLLALDAATGKRLWHFQTVHHDIWDRDIPAPPNLFTVRHKGKKVHAVSILSKQGFLFVFDRVTGKPLFPVEERPMPASTVPGERAWPTQPIPLKPAPFTKQTFTEADINDFVTDRDTVVAQLRRWQKGHPFFPLPLSPNRTVFFPGTDGGAQWGGAAVDENEILYVPAKEIPVTMGLVPTSNVADKNVGATGAQLYQTHCAACHGPNREGSHDGTYPALAAVSQKRTEAAVAQVLNRGQGMMPAFRHLSEAERRAIVEFLFGKNSSATASKTGGLDTAPYHHTGFTRWYDRAGYPVSRPPWGTLTAIDLNTGEHRWRVPLGEYPELVAKGIPPTGTDNYGAPVVTAGGLLFIASSRDELIRAFDRKTGRELWRAKLPAAGYASPSTYAVGGRQYVVIACGGGKLRTKSGDRYVAFALP